MRGADFCPSFSAALALVGQGSTFPLLAHLPSEDRQGHRGYPCLAGNVTMNLQSTTALSSGWWMRSRFSGRTWGSLCHPRVKAYAQASGLREKPAYQC